MLLEIWQVIQNAVENYYMWLPWLVLFGFGRVLALGIFGR